MKLSKLQHAMIGYAELLEIVYIDDWLLRKEGFCIRIHTSFGHSLLNRGGRPIFYKTVRGAYGAACELRPDLRPHIEPELLDYK